MTRTISFAIAGLLFLSAGTVYGQVLQSQTTWGAAGAEFSGGVAVAPDGSAYLTGTSDSFAFDEFNNPEARIFLLKFSPTGALDWQRIWNGPSVHGKPAIAIAPDASVYVTGLSKSNDGDAVLLKFSPTGALLDSSAIAFARAIQAEGGGGVVGIAPLLVKIDANGNLVFDREWGGNKSGGEGSGVAIASNGLIYMSGTITGLGGGFQDAFVIGVQANGKAGSAATWGGPGFETSGGVALAADGTVVLGATTTLPPPYALQSAPRKVSNPKGTLSAAPGVLIDVTGVVANPAAGAATPNGSTSYGGNFEAALVRFVP